MTVMPEREAYFSGAYWGPRKESPEECAQRTATFLNLLASCDPFLADWFAPARSRKDARKHPLMPPDVPTLAEWFRRGANREDGGPAMKELGFGFWFDNGGPPRDCADLRIYCGGWAEAVSNSCFLSLPTQGPNAERVLASPILRGVVRSMALAWDPDWAVAMSRSHRDMLDKEGKADVWLGWVTYLSRRQGIIPPLPAPVCIEPVEEKGTLIILTPERFTATRPEHIDLATRVRQLLQRAGVLPPLRPIASR